jgi:hypothetical protein
MIDYSVTVDQRTVNNCIAKFDSYDKAIQDGLRHILNKSTLKIQGKARHLSPVDTGRNRSAIQLYETIGGLSVGVGSNVNYASPLEFGSLPHFPPIDALIPWVKRHWATDNKFSKSGKKYRIVNSSESAIRGMAFVLARSISKKGTKARPFLYPPYNEEKPLFIQSIIKLMQDAGRL